MGDTQTPPPFSSFAKTSAKLLRAVLYDEAPRPADKRKDSDREQVAGEVVVTEMLPAGEQGGKHRVFIRDLSKGGCGLWSRSRIPPGASVLVAFVGGDGKATQRMGIVRHCRGQEGTGFAVGVQFDAKAA